MRFVALCLLFPLLNGLHPQLSASEYKNTIYPLLTNYCVECHNAETKKAGLDLQSLTADEKVALADSSLWEEIADVVEHGEMPPPKAKQLKPAQYKTLLAFARKAQQERLTYEKHMKPLLDKYCIECHSKTRGRTVKGLFRHPIDFDHAETKDGRDRWLAWHRVATRAKRHDMPPKKGKYSKASMRPTAAEYKIMETWARQQQRRQNSDLDCSDFGIRDYRWEREQSKFVWSRRRTIAEYRHAVDDLLGIEILDAGLLPAEGSGDGYAKNGQNMYMSSAHLEKFLSAIDVATKQLMTSEKRDVQQAKQALLADFDVSDVPQSVRKVLKPLMRRAFAREIDEATLDRFAKVAVQAVERGQQAEDALRLALCGVLVSPSFVYIRDEEGTRDRQGAMTNYALAARMAAFLWSSVPDKALLDAAKAKTLQGEGLRQQVKRMLQDPRSARLARYFGSRWLAVEGLGREQEPDPGTFPDYDAALQDAMLAEVEVTLAHWLQSNAPLDRIIDADYVFVNERLARHYGIAGVKGAHLQKVARPGPYRGGVLGMSAPLTTTSAPDRTNVVLRGAWVLEKLLGEHVPEPPPDAGNLPPPNLDGKVLTLRQRMELHSTNPTCMACHQKLDPLGFSLEAFDATGRWLKSSATTPIDDLGTLSDGTRIEGVGGLKRVLKQRKDQVFKSVSVKLMRFAIGRPFKLYDRCSTDELVHYCTSNGWTWHNVVEQIVMSDSFRMRHYGAVYEPRLVIIEPKGAKGNSRKKKKK